MFCKFAYSKFAKRFARRHPGRATHFPHPHSTAALCNPALAMEAPPTPREERSQPTNLTINAPDTPEQIMFQQDTPPSPSTLVSCSTTEARSPTRSPAHPPLSPAWEAGKEDDQHQHWPALSPGGSDRLPLLVRPPNPTASVATLRADLVPPRAPLQHRAPAPLTAPAASEVPVAPPPAAAASAAPAASSAAPAPPSPAGGSVINTNDVGAARARRGFFAGSSTHSPHTPVPASPSPSSGETGIFHLDLDSPLADAGTPLAVQGSPHCSVQDSDGESLGGHAAAGASASAAISPGVSMPWGRVAPSPDDTQPLQGSWGRVQEEVCARLKIILLLRVFFPCFPG